MVRQKREDFDEAAKVKIAELSAYGSSDVVIAISDQDKALLTRDDRKLNVDVIPLIFPVPALQPRRERSSCNLLFVGNFEHAANVDAVSFFCDSAFPALRRRLPSVKLTIIGNSPNAAIKNRASSDIQVLGFVPELSPYYESSDISVAPLTWGGGLKGKIAEAMSFGLPVVATTVGIDGFRLTPGENVVVADTVDEIVEGIIKLHQDRQFYERIRTKAWQFVEQNYGDRAVREQLEGVIARLENCKAKEMPAWKKLKRKVPIFLDTHLLWRFRR